MALLADVCVGHIAGQLYTMQAACFLNDAKMRQPIKSGKFGMHTLDGAHSLAPNTALSGTLHGVDHVEPNPSPSQVISTSVHASKLKAGSTL